jgi:hypothetical protein
MWRVSAAENGLVGPLQPQTTYNITVVSTTIGGSSSPSNPFTLTTSAAGLQFHGIPINALLLEGHDYEIQVLYPVAIQWGGFNEGGAPTPFTVDGAITVVNGTESGSPSNTILPHLSVSWVEGPGLNPLDITLPFLGAPSGTSNVSTVFGKYVQALHDQELSSLGFYADIAPGGTLIANVYKATGTTRGQMHGSWRPWISTVVVPPPSRAAVCGLPIEVAGRTATRTTTSAPFEMPPAIPPE